ncbi:MAG: FAD-dependent oxidoreductase, partial [Planctomycetes bacterium]|nr:FAD-dependent oxidoreductase [Planctomycetota bacterium]
MSNYDVIVIGVGGMGSATVYHLARRGLSVLGLEQFDVAHDRGSSHGQTRIMRKGYFEHLAYVPLLHKCYAMWSELEAATGARLFERCGLILFGPPDGAVISGVRRAAREHDLDIQSLSVAEAVERFPGLRPSPDMAVMFEQDAGILYVEEGVRTFAAQAIALGATIETG